MTHYKYLILTTVLFFALLLPLQAQEAPTENLTDSCVTDYDESVDYFPDKTELDYAVGFSVAYYNHYKVVTVSAPFPGAAANDAFQYVLVQCGTPAPQDFDDVPMIEVPVNRFIAMSTTQLPHLVNLDALDKLVGLDSFLYVNTPEVRELIDAGELVEVGNSTNINVEIVLDAEPDVIMPFALGSDGDAHPILLDAGVFTAINGSWVETSPLGRTEWLKYIALFFNKEAQAEAIFAETAADYEALVALAATVPAAERRSVLWNRFSFYNDAWNIPGGASYAGQLLVDAGADFVMSDAPEVQDATGSVQFAFEAVYESALGADVWLPVGATWNTLDDVLAEDDRYADFSAWQNGAVYNNNVRLNENGGNDYYETGSANPSLVLADVIAILYPDLLPEHELMFFKRLD